MMLFVRDAMKALLSNYQIAILSGRRTG